MTNRAFAYCRVATEAQADTALHQQGRLLQEYCSKNGMTLVGQVRVAEAGTDIGRDSLRDLLNQAKAGSYDILIVYSMDRICRNTVLMNCYCQNLLLCGVRIIAVREGMEITPSALATISGLGEMKIEERVAGCEVCGRDMKTTKGCAVLYVHIAGKKHKRIPNDTERCHDCGAGYGEIHHWGCDAERCPVCGLQLISCDCEDVYCEA